jgi:hypothetical protein
VCVRLEDVEAAERIAYYAYRILKLAAIFA